MTKAKPFNLQYDAATGIYMVEALREKARKERQEARAHQTNAGIETGASSDFHALKMVQADNRAKLLEDAAADIKETVHQGLVADFATAFERRGAKAEAKPARVCDHRQCPRDECWGC